MDRDDENNYQNAWLRRNYEKLKTLKIDNDPEMADISNRVRKVNNKQERKANYSAIVEKVKALSECGKTQKQIAELLAISIGSVNKFLNMK